MPQTFTYPGVYIEEVPSAVHTITGVATSIAAFVGWAPAGPTGKATLIQSFSDFANQFHGLDRRSLLGYSVNQFFGNGGQQTYIVRLVAPDAKIGAIPVPASGGGTAFTADAIDEGQGPGSTVSALCRTRRTPRVFRSWWYTRQRPARRQRSKTSPTSRC